MEFRKPELDLTERLWIDSETKVDLRFLKKKRKQSMARVVKELSRREVEVEKNKSNQ